MGYGHGDVFRKLAALRRQRRRGGTHGVNFGSDGGVVDVVEHLLGVKQLVLRDIGGRELQIQLGTRRDAERGNQRAFRHGVAAVGDAGVCQCNDVLRVVRIQLDGGGIAADGAGIISGLHCPGAQRGEVLRRPEKIIQPEQQRRSKHQNEQRNQKLFHRDSVLIRTDTGLL